MKRNGRNTKPKVGQKKRGPGRPPIWCGPIRSLKKTQFLIARNKSEAMTIYIAGRRMGIAIRVQKQPDGTYRCFRK